MAQKRLHTRAFGDIGEAIACGFLSNRGYAILVRNYQKTWGELDIVATQGPVLHFFEVKSMAYDYDLENAEHKPEDNVHGLKVRSIRRMIETYMHEKGHSEETEFYFHVLCVFVDLDRRKSRIRWIKNVIL